MARNRRDAAEDRRRAYRAPFVAAVKQRRNGEVALAQCQNLCETGMELRRPADEIPLAGSFMSLVFELPDGESMVEARCAVVFEQPQGSFQRTGIRFVEISRRDRRRIARFVKKSQQAHDRRSV